MTPETLPTPKFAIGDVVQLKSGGPLMTVSDLDVDDNLKIECMWFYDNANSSAADFNPECLRKSDYKGL